MILEEKRSLSPHDTTALNGPGPPHYRGFTIRYTTVGMPPLHDGLARRKDNTQHSQQQDIHEPGRIRTRRDSNPQSQQTSGRRPTP